MLVNQDLIDKATGAMQKWDDAHEKLCDVFTDPRPTHEDHLTIQRAMGHAATAKQILSTIIPQVEP